MFRFEMGMFIFQTLIQKHMTFISVDGSNSSTVSSIHTPQTKLNEKNMGSRSSSKAPSSELYNGDFNTDIYYEIKRMKRDTPIT